MRTFFFFLFFGNSSRNSSRNKKSIFFHLHFCSFLKDKGNSRKIRKKGTSNAHRCRLGSRTSSSLAGFPPFFFFLSSFCYAATTHDTTPSACFPRDFRFPPQLRLSYPIYRAILRIYPRILKRTRNSTRARAKMPAPPVSKFPRGFRRRHASPQKIAHRASFTHLSPSRNTLDVNED